MNPNIKLFIICASILFAGCNPRYYVPNTQNIPLIKSKNQISVSIAGNTNQLDLQGAIGITDATALQVNTVFVSNDDKHTGNGGSGQFYEAGAGYYTKIGEHGLFDTYALGGVGTMKNTFPSTLSENPSTTGKISATLYRVGLQPSISYLTKYFSISGSARILSLYHSNIAGSLVFENTDQIKYLNANNSNFLIEPALTIRAGIENVKLQMQVIRSFNLGNPNFRQDYSLLSFGLSFKFK